MRKSRTKSGPLTTLVVWFIVKPLELMVRGLTSLLTVRRGQPAFPPPVGWHNTAYGPMYWDGARWIWPDGRVAF